MDCFDLVELDDVAVEKRVALAVAKLRAVWHDEVPPEHVVRLANYRLQPWQIPATLERVKGYMAEDKEKNRKDIDVKK